MEWTIRPCERARAAELARALAISQVTGGVLVRRGYADPATAAAFLEGANPAHDPALLADMEQACVRIRSAIAAGTRICVHGDYDADGICAAACALAILRELG